MGKFLNKKKFEAVVSEKKKGNKKIKEQHQKINILRIPRGCSNNSAVIHYLGQLVMTFIFF